MIAIAINEQSRIGTINQPPAWIKSKRAKPVSRFLVELTGA
jgi:hypothetical protein